MHFAEHNFKIAEKPRMLVAGCYYLDCNTAVCYYEPSRPFIVITLGMLRALLAPIVCANGRRGTRLSFKIGDVMAAAFSSPDSRNKFKLIII